MRKNVLTFGLLGGLLSVLLVIGGFIFGSGEMSCENMEGGELVGYITMLVALSTIFVGIKRFRDKVAGGSISFGKAFLMGLYMSLIAAACYTIAWMAYYETEKGSQFGEQYYECQIASIEQQDLPAEEEKAMIAKMEAEWETYENPVWRAVFTTLEILPVGILVSLIAAGILRRKAATT